MPDHQSKKAWMVEINSDLTEGRGYNYPAYICEKRATARRLAKKQNAQGSDGIVSEIVIHKKKGYWQGPINLISPTKEDDRAQERIDRREQAIKKAKDLGLSDEDILALTPYTGGQQ